MNNFDFTNDWFSRAAKPIWDKLIPKINPSKILEIGSYEGASACYLIQRLANNAQIEIHCIDTWEGGIDNKDVGTDMSAVESRFAHNINIAVERAAGRVEVFTHKGFSDVELSKLLANGKRNYFDFVYVDGSHQAPDVLCDAVLGFRLLKIGGFMVFDDYLWSENLPYGKDPLRCPKQAIDSFTNLYFRKVNIISTPLYQLFVQKVSE